ncbi:hypothetical protein PNEG_01230 [Pneumocystis murina B123]|uniref:K Homology domain-containing protein n=1 Tax=Pneumocystis murina (strain B123) TaxID=1069680 RepID=M7P9H6_PNEMU|nr:hypothetical protein PNEG_01230 [Pneumocystis murina B123]EMR10520.1 hypothetical protein PNEG_01230 [Pneumocystis murina B123]
MTELSTSFNVDKMARFPGLPLGTTHGTANNVSNDGLTKNLLFESSYTPLQGNGEVQESRIETKNEGYSNSQLTLRALVSTKEAGIIIGRQGKNVAELRGANGIKAGVSKVVPNIYDRVLTISGTLEGVSKAYGTIAQSFINNPIGHSNHHLTSSSSEPQSSIRLLVSHNMMGTIIGRQGLKIKHIQDISGARMIAFKDILPQSTERIVEVQGVVSSIQSAIWEIGKCLIDDWERGIGTVFYNPSVRLSSASSIVPGHQTNSIFSGPQSGHFLQYQRQGSHLSYSRLSNLASHFQESLDASSQDICVQNISIPSDMVGCIIGRGGSKISEIRRISGSKISIAKAPHDETGERMFTIQGTSSSNEKALYLLFQTLETEKNRRGQENLK